MGGFAGISSGDTEILRSRSYGSVNGGATSDRVGGFAGGLEGGAEVYESFTHGAVTGYQNVGGFVGRLDIADLLRAYATGTITGTTSVGGFVGLYSGTGAICDSCHWNSDMTANDGGGSMGTAPTGLSTADLQNPSNFSAWPTSIWDIQSGQFPNFL